MKQGFIAILLGGLLVASYVNKGCKAVEWSQSDEKAEKAEAARLKRQAEARAKAQEKERAFQAWRSKQPPATGPDAERLQRSQFEQMLLDENLRISREQAAKSSMPYVRRPLPSTPTDSPPPPPTPTPGGNTAASPAGGAPPTVSQEPGAVPR